MGWAARAVGVVHRRDRARSRPARLAAGLRLAERRSEPRRRAALCATGHRAAQPSRRARRLEDEIEALFDRGLDRRPARRAADRGAGLAHARGHDPRARRGRRGGAARPRRLHGREGRGQRGHGRLRPEYLPVVLAALEAACTDEFNMHGLLATTYRSGRYDRQRAASRPRIGMNSGVNVLGQGNRANLTIGRALQLVIRNVGGGRPAGVDRATHGNPGKLSFCFAGGRGRLAVGAAARRPRLRARLDTVTLFAGEGPRGIVDQLRGGRSPSPGRWPRACARCGHPKLPRLRRRPRRLARARPGVPGGGLEPSGSA